MITTLLSQCTGSPFVEKDHSLITGNLEIITNNTLLKLFSKGWKYQENRTANYEKADYEVTGIKSCIQSWCNKHFITTSSFFK